MDNREVFKPLLTEVSYWLNFAKCEGDCNDCDQNELCRTTVEYYTKLKAIFNGPELRSMNIDVQSEEENNR